MILPNENVLTVGARTLRVYNSQTELKNEICRINLSEISDGLDYINEFINLSVKEGDPKYGFILLSRILDMKKIEAHGELEHATVNDPAKRGGDYFMVELVADADKAQASVAAE